MKASELLGDFGRLANKQYLFCRDSGYSSEELVGKNYRWYQANRETLLYTDSKAPALKKQLAYLEANGIELDSPDYTYSEARKLIREVAKHQNRDTRYLTEIIKYEAHNAARVNRGKSRAAHLQENNNDELVLSSLQAAQNTLHNIPIISGTDDWKRRRDFEPLAAPGN